MSVFTNVGRKSHFCTRKCSHCFIAYFSIGIDLPARRIFNSGTRLKWDLDLTKSTQNFNFLYLYNWVISSVATALLSSNRNDAKR